MRSMPFFFGRGIRLKEKFSKPLALLTAAAAGVLIAGTIALAYALRHAAQQKENWDFVVSGGDGVWYSVITLPRENAVLAQSNAWVNGGFTSRTALFALAPDAFRQDYQPYFSGDDSQLLMQVAMCSDIDQVVFRQTFQSTVTGMPEPFEIKIYGDGRIEESPQGHRIFLDESVEGGATNIIAGVLLEYDENEEILPSVP